VSVSITPPGGGQRLGTIAKEFSGFAKELLTDADNFHCVFPADATPQQKLCLLSCVFLIDFMFFESSSNSNDD
jgi:hypothetical protein